MASMLSPTIFLAFFMNIKKQVLLHNLQIDCEVCNKNKDINEL